MPSLRVKPTIVFVAVILFFQFLSQGIICFADVQNGDEFTVYKYASFDDKIGLAVKNYGGSIERQEDNGNGLLHCMCESGTVSNSFADAVCCLISAENIYTVEVMVKPISIQGTSYIELFDAKNSLNEWRLGARLNSNGKISMNGLNVGMWTAGQWLRYSAVYNVSQGKCDLYINGTCTAEDIDVGTLRPTTFRIDMNSSKGDGNIEFYLDEYIIYAGGFVDDRTWPPITMRSVMDSKYAAKRILGDASAFSMMGGYYFIDGEKQEYKGENLKPKIKDNIAFVSTDFISSILDKDISLSGNNIKVGTIADFSLGSSVAIINGVSISLPAGVYEENGLCYIPAQSVATAVQKQYMYDKRGFFVYSDEEFKNIDSEHFIDMFEPVDIIYRYLTFAEAGGDEMIADLRRNISVGQHPRILYTDNDIQYINAKKKTNDDSWKRTTLSVVSLADKAKTYDNVLTADCPDSSKQSQAVLFQTAITNLANGYILTGDSSYADKALTYITTLCEWTTLALDTSELTTGHWSMGMAIGYDTFYDYYNTFNEGIECLAAIKDSAKNLAFADTISAYEGNGDARWITILDNFSGVIGGGLMALTLALADEADMRDDIVFLLENIIKTNELAVSLYQTNGGYFEGVSYSGYMLGNLILSTEALFHCCGKDYGLGNCKGFTDAGDFVVYMQTKDHTFNFHDCGASVSGGSSVPAWFALRYGKTQASELNRKLDSLRNADMGLLGLLYYSKSVELYGNGNADGAATDKYFDVTEAGSFRNNFDDYNQTFVGFHGGWTNLTHDMLDTGEFVFESDGVRWALDLGSDSYGLPDYFGSNGYKIYRKKTEGENCVVINPTVNPNTYFGQALNERAVLTDYETSPRAAKAAYDLTAPYKRDVNAYTRGYFFGDERNTLTVRDEISLKSSSEVYWFMHTAAEIEIKDQNTAILTCNGKKLLAQVYCNAENYELLSMEAEPLTTSPDIEGQADNSAYKKLSVHITNATDELVIAVKLIPQNEFVNAKELSDIPISQWTLPDGPLQSELIVSDISVDPSGYLSGIVQTPSDAGIVRIYVDGNEEYSFEAVKTQTRIEGIDISKMSYGSHELKIAAELTDGTKNEYATRFEYNKYNKEILYENNLAYYGGSTINDDNNWYFYKYGNGSADGMGYNLVPDGISSVLLGYRTGYSSSSINDGIYVAQCDVKFSTTLGYFVFELQNSGKSWYLHDIKVFNAGSIANGTSYVSGKWYNVLLAIDTKNSLCSVYVNHEPIIKDLYVENADSVTCCKLQYVSQTSGAEISYRNFETYQLRSQSVKAMIEVEKIDDGFLTVATVRGLDVGRQNKLLLVICSYNKDRMIDIKMVETVTDLSDAVVKNGIRPSDNTNNIVVFFWDKETMEPFCTKYYYSIIR